jgi:hypothetical protein
MCRKVARAHTEGRTTHVDITPTNLSDFLGPQVFFAEVAERTSVPGVVTGLAWTPTGGDILICAMRCKSDEEINGAIRNAWSLNPSVHESDIRVNVMNGYARLTGVVGSMAEKLAAEEDASLPGLAGLRLNAPTKLTVALGGKSVDLGEE